MFVPRHPCGSIILARGSVHTEIVHADDNSIACYSAPLNRVVMNLVSSTMDTVDDGTVWIGTERGGATFRIFVAGGRIAIRGKAGGGGVAFIVRRPRDVEEASHAA